MNNHRNPVWPGDALAALGGILESSSYQAIQPGPMPTGKDLPDAELERLAEEMLRNRRKAAAEVDGQA